MSSLPIDNSISLNLKNNTNLPQRVNILGGTQDPLAVPPHRLYQWDLSSESYNGNLNVTILISNTSNPTPVANTVAVNGNNIQAVLFALNSLNKGFFQVSGNVIYVSNDYYIYGALSLDSVFISVWNTANTSGTSSASNQIQLPLSSSGVYNFVVDWGDGSQNTITSYIQPESLHTYAVGGVYTLKITGVIDDWSFAFQNSPLKDNIKILNISSWGNLRFGITDYGTFYFCSNLSLSSVIGNLDLSLSTDFSLIFEGCTSLTTINGIENWDTSNITIMTGAFANATNFNSNISNWNVSNVTDMNVMFYNAFAFNQNISSWNISNVTDFSNFMFGKSASNYSSAYLNAIYNTWSLLPVQPNIGIDFGSIKYTVAGQAGKNILTGAPNNWVISDGGI
jgi:surface protein